MPHNWEYVLSAYGIWAVTFAVYAIWLARRSRVVGRALRRLEQSGQGESRAQA